MGKSLLEEMMAEPVEKIATGEGAADVGPDPNPEQDDEEGIDAVEALARAMREAQQKREPQKPAEAPLQKKDLRALDERPVEMKRVRWSDDPDVHDDVCGLKEGSRFIMRDCGKDLDGEWEVIQVNASAASAEERNIFAQRPNAGPPYIKMFEIDVTEEIHLGRLVIKNDD